MDPHSEGRLVTLVRPSLDRDRERAPGLFSPVQAESEKGMP